MFFLNMILVYKKINTQIRKCFFCVQLINGGEAN